LVRPSQSGAGERGEDGGVVISERLLTIARCPDCGGRLGGAQPDAPACQGCGRAFAATPGYLDLRPREVFDEQTRYTDERLHADARHERVSPPLLASGVRNDMLREFLRPAVGDLVIDFGCGSGRTLVWNQGCGAYQVGVDVSPFFAREALAGADLALGDLRKLPFADGAFTKGYALDVFEHLSRDGLTGVLREAARVLRPGGQLFVYSHVRKNSRLALGLRAINWTAGLMHRAGVVDLTQEHLRKSDHLNPLADIPDLERTVGEAGFQVARIRYYTPLIGGVVENLMVRSVERWMARRAAMRAARENTTAGAVQPGADGPGTDERAAFTRAARMEAKDRIARGGPVLAGLKVLTALMKLDVLVFGRVRSGPFFALLEKRAE
jgi:SAM-dependent methyltransferase